VDTLKVVVISNNINAVSRVMYDWGLVAPQFSAFQFSEGLAVLYPDGYSMLFAHRALHKEALASGQFDAFGNFEDDQELTWAAAQSWAHDTRVLEPLGLARGFLRTEYSITGEIVLLDTESISSLPNVVPL
jgi:hypothetical protein